MFTCVFNRMLQLLREDMEIYLGQLDGRGSAKRPLDERSQVARRLQIIVTTHFCIISNSDA